MEGTRFPNPTTVTTTKNARGTVGTYFQSHRMPAGYIYRLKPLQYRSAQPLETSFGILQEIVVQVYQS